MIIPNKKKLAFHFVLAAATLASLAAIGYVVFDSILMPRIARSGWEVAPVPDLTGLSLEQATQKLTDIGLDPLVDPERRKGDRVSPDHVALQRPAPGDSVKKGHVVRLWLSAGSTTIAVPDLAGQDSTEAFTHTQEAGLEMAGTDYTVSSRIPAGKVVRTDPAAGTLLVRGSSIRLLFSSGADPDSLPVKDTAKAGTTKSPNIF